MTESIIQNYLNPFWASKIDRIDIDLTTSAISLTIITVVDGISSNHNLSFDGVSSFFYVSRDDKKQLLPWQYAELSEIYYLVNGDHLIQHIQAKKNAPQYSTRPNFLIEIWSSALFIKARGVTIDGVHFESK